METSQNVLQEGEGNATASRMPESFLDKLDEEIDLAGGEWDEDEAFIVTIIDLSDTDSPQVNNLVISEILRGLHLQQDENYKQYEKQVKAGKTDAQMKKVVVISEEAHEFLSSDRIKQMETLFKQVARIARRGRKRWLGLVFVTQLLQHLPDDVLGLINNYILHKIADSNVISRLKRSIGGVDGGLWQRLPSLAPGQAIISAANLARPLLVAIDSTPCKLRMVD
jgi:hypothetical protein